MVHLIVDELTLGTKYLAPIGSRDVTNTFVAVGIRVLSPIVSSFGPRRHREMSITYVTR